VLQKVRTAFPDLEKTTEDMFAEGDRVLDRVSVRCTHTGEFRGQPATGKTIVLSEMHVARVINGQIIERWGEWDQLSLLQQVGMIDVSSSPGASAL
jgi:predicted ester cyclase